MKLVMTLVPGGDADLVEAQVSFHLAAGVDEVVPADSGFDDATELGADWVFSCGAGELWWPRGGTLKEVLAVVPRRFGVVRAMVRRFVPRPLGDPFFAERLTERLAAPEPHVKTLYRPGADLPLRGWYPVEVFRFPVGTSEQEVIGGTLVTDTRARDAFRALREGRSPDFGQPTIDQAYVSDVAALEAEDEGLRAQRRIEQLERRLGALEAGVASRLRSRLGLR